jgi:hypothetical protein
MIGLVIVSTILMAFQAADSPASKREQKPTPEVATGVNDGEVNAKYNALKEQTPLTPAAQWRLGLWCEEHGLKHLAYVHFAEVARLDPKRDAVWRKLGFKKVGGRWTTDEQIAEEREQKKAEKEWAPRLKKIHQDIHGTHGVKRRDIAEAALADVSDPRAILPLYREFGGGGQIDQILLVQLLGQIDNRLSSKVLAMLAVYGKTPEVRGRATATLRGRRAEEFRDVLVGLMIDPYKYEVKRVGGPGSPGILFVEGEKFNVSRFYAPPAAPNLTPQPGDIITFDASGMPVIARPSITSIGKRIGVPGSKTLIQETDRVQYDFISPAGLIAEAQRAALIAEAQLEADAAMIKSINDGRKQFNDLVMAVASDATGKNSGPTPKEWREALAGPNQSNRPSKTPNKPTFGEMATLVYQPVFAPTLVGSKTITQTRFYVDT